MLPFEFLFQIKEGVLRFYTFGMKVGFTFLQLTSEVAKQGSRSHEKVCMRGKGSWNMWKRWHIQESYVSVNVLYRRFHLMIHVKRHEKSYTGFTVLRNSISSHVKNGFYGIFFTP